MASSNREVMVVLSDGKPVTVIKTKNAHSEAGKSDHAKGRSVGMDSFRKDYKDNHSQLSSPVRQDNSKHKDTDEHVELRRLRSENQLLQDRLVHLEELMASEKRESDECIERLKKQVTEMVESEQSSRTRIEHLMSKVNELQIHQDALREEPVNDEVQVVQDELVASKLREAEAKSSFKELQQKFHNLERQWQIFHQETNTIKESETKVKNQMHAELKDQLMTLRIRETSLVSELSEIRQKLMELETQNHIYERQTKRQESENARLLEKIGGAELAEKELNNVLKTLERKVYDLESQQKEDRVMFKIREAEFCQTAAELRRRIAELEIENQELLTSAQLHNKDQDVKEMENRLLELQEEILQMKFRMSESNTIDDLSLMNAMTESFIGDVCLQPANFDSIVNFSDCLAPTKDFLDND